MTHYIGDGAPNEDGGTTSAPMLVVTVAATGDVIDLPPEELADETAVDEYVATLTGFPCGVEIEIVALSEWPDASRWWLLQLLHRVAVPANYIVGDHVYQAAFDAVLAGMVGPEDPAACERGRRAGIEAVAIWHPDAIDAAVSRVRQRLAELGVAGVLPQSLKRQVKQLLGQAAQGAGMASPQQIAQYVLGQLHGDEVDSEQDSTDDSPDLRYFRDQFWRWRGSCWEPVPMAALTAQITQVLQDAEEIPPVTSRLVNDVIANLKALALLGCWSESPPFLISSEDPIQLERPQYLPMRNGLLDLSGVMEGGEPPVLLPHDHRYFSQTVIPYDYDPEAEAPLWDETLERLLPSTRCGDQRQDVLQQIFGYALLNGWLGLQKFFVFVGAGANGKSTVLDTLVAMLGDANVSHVPLDKLNGEFRLGEMAGKLANICGDKSYMDKADEGLLKQLTSGDLVQVNRKYKEPITLRPTAKLIFATNFLPPISDRSDGIWRRLIVLPFLERIAPSEMDIYRSERLRDELPGILNWAIDGAIDLITYGRFVDCAVCIEARDGHRVNSDPFQQFVDEATTLGADRSVLVANLYQAYRDYCESTGQKPTAQPKFGARVLELAGVSRVRRTTGAREYEYRGVGLTGAVRCRPYRRQP